MKDEETGTRDGPSGRSLPIPASVICHEIRNLGEYEGDLDVNERIVTDLISARRAVAAKLGALPPLT
jgi:hypothetical protein